MARLGKLGSAILLSIPMLAAPAIAHTVKASGNVGAIFMLSQTTTPKQDSLL
jgi:hypothetical protein